MKLFSHKYYLNVYRIFIFDFIFCRNLGAKAFEVSADKKYVYLAHDSFKVKLRGGEKLIFPQNKKDQERKLSSQLFFGGPVASNFRPSPPPLARYNVASLCKPALQRSRQISWKSVLTVQI